MTEDWKIELETQYDYEEENFELSDGEDVTSTTTNQFFDGLIVRSLTSHWSAGVQSRAGSSTFNNLDFELRGGPAIEYNIFPYSEYNERQLLLCYEVSPTYNQYSDTTIFGKTEEFLVEQRLRADLEITQTWGGVNAFVEGSAFMRDFSENRLDMGLSIEFRIFRGLSLNVGGGYTVINDQITLPAEDITDEEALLRQRQQATSFEYDFSIGLRYTFGSIYNSTVNPRFDL